MKVEAIIKDKLVKLVLVDGMETRRIRHCGARQVFLLNNSHVVKFDNPTYYDPEFRDQTLLELELAATIEEEDKKFFAMPVTFGAIDDIAFTVQEKLERSLKLPSTKEVEEFDDIIHKYNLAVDVGYYPKTDLTHNCYYTKEGFKIYDYVPFES